MSQDHSRSARQGALEMGDADIAICLSGQMRQFGVCLTEFFEKLADPLAADIFIHTWDHVGGTAASKPTLANVARTAGGRTVHLISESGRYAPKADHAVTPEMIEGIYRPVLCEVENQEAVVERVGLRDMVPPWLREADAFTDGMVEMFYTQHRAHALRQRHERTRGRPYRLVVNAIPDLFWHGRLPEFVLAGREIFWSDSQSITPSFQVSCKLGVASSPLMDVYASVFPNLPALFDPAVLARPWTEWPIGERLLRQWLNRNAVPIAYFEAPAIRIRERLVPLADCRWV